MKNIILKTDEVGILALGGLGEIGKNMYLIEYNQKIFIVDAGLMFPDESLLGISHVIPNFEYLQQNQDRIEGLFITHGHEDHIGAIPYLIQRVNIPKIYASGIAVDLIEHKLNEFKNIVMPRIEVYKSHYTYKFDDIVVEFVRLNHSIPDSHGIVFKTPAGIIFHTGDFKIDLTPVGPQTEFDKLSQLGREGVLCLLSDSTNAEREELIESESKIGNSITELFGLIKGRIIIATFASNLYRIQQIIEASISNNRKVAVFGRSMEKTIEIGIQSGYIKVPRGTIIDSDAIDQHPMNEITLIVTGSQGEPLAALSRISSGSHRQIKALKGDTVIFSSSPIPGNQEGINKNINALYRLGVEVIVDGPLADTHTSGHGSQIDLKLMLSLTKPKFFIPIHGEHRMLKKHKELAIDVGVSPNNILVMDNGDFAAVSKDSLRIAGHVTANDIYVDNSKFGDISSSIIWERRLLSEEGMFVVVLTIDADNKKLLLEPTIVSRGFIYLRGSTEITDELVEIAKNYIEKELEKPTLFNEQFIKKELNELIQTKIMELTQRKPIITIVIRNIHTI
ncbi:MAG: ribonuclease J [Acholeplasmataceae bacterium]|jgi:ribonuclease J|nr:ribonuclease J [Acholeplasmataceae bacterium]